MLSSTCVAPIPSARTHLAEESREPRLVGKRGQRKRNGVLACFANLLPCLIGMEACPGSQQLARALISQGHQARIMPAQFVRPFVKANMNDFNEATAIAEAVMRPTMRFVPVKNSEQPDLQALRRARDRFVHDRTAVVNQIRAFQLENELPLRTGRSHLPRKMSGVLEDAENGISMRLRALLVRLWRHWQWLEELGISKRGDSYPRRLLIHGARSVCMQMRRERHALGRWIDNLQSRRNVVVVAIANRMARIAWAVLSRGNVYRTQGT